MTRQHPARPTRLLTLGVLAVVANAIAAQDEGLDFFEKKIRPVLVQHCYKCHSAEAEQKGKLKGGIAPRGGSIREVQRLCDALKKTKWDGPDDL